MYHSCLTSLCGNQEALSDLTMAFQKMLCGNCIPVPSSAPPEGALSTATPAPSSASASSPPGLWSAQPLCWRCPLGSAEALSSYQTCFYRYTPDDLSRWGNATGNKLCWQAISMYSPKNHPKCSNIFYSLRSYKHSKLKWKQRNADA